MWLHVPSWTLRYGDTTWTNRHNFHNTAHFQSTCKSILALLHFCMRFVITVFTYLAELLKHALFRSGSHFTSGSDGLSQQKLQKDANNTAILVNEVLCIWKTCLSNYIVNIISDKCKHGNIRVWLQERQQTYKLEKAIIHPQTIGLACIGKHCKKHNLW